MSIDNEPSMSDPNAPGIKKQKLYRGRIDKAAPVSLPLIDRFTSFVKFIGRA